MGEKISEISEGGSTRLYSPYPFPWRVKTGGLRDDFGRLAWIQFQKDSGKPYYRFEKQNGQKVLRYATADLMRPSCIECHNSHPDTPRDDWKVGDVRGILEISRTVRTSVGGSMSSVRAVIITTALILGCIVLLVGIIVFRLKSATLKLQKRKDEMAEVLHERGILLREIHHRVKNNLQVVSTLLGLQSDTVKDEDTKRKLKDAEERVRSMSMIHQQLYESNDFGKIDCHDYLETLTHNLLITYSESPGNVQLDLNSHGVTLDINTAIPCALIINELVSNCLKYAWNKDEMDQKLKVHLSQIDDHIELVVSDNGKGFPEDFNIETCTSLGMVLINSLVGQLEGTLERKNEGGTEFRIRFPYLAKSPSKKGGLDPE
ncbi:MAG: DUF3365 domain-containing protein [Candidatus Margulisbacteria bacterium]|nr:DUF3365 domain-containing protein [Candidatus Margulisiibacteriota bacterium]